MAAAITLLPLLHVTSYGLTVGWDAVETQLWRPRIGMLLRNTVSLVVVGSILSMLLALACAWIVERTNVPLPSVWRALLVAPLAIPAFVNGYAWVSVTHAVEGFAGAVMIVTLSYFPLVYLPVTASLRRTDPVLEETATSLGLSWPAAFVRVVLPQLRPALLGGGLLVALHLLAEFGALQLLRFPTFTTAVYDQFETTFNGPAANLTAMVLAILAVIILCGELKLQGNAHLIRSGSGTSRRPTRHDLGRWRVLAVLALASVTTLAVGVPLAILTKWMIEGSSTSFPLDDLLLTTGNSLALGALGALVCVALAIPVALLLVRWPGRLPAALERSTYVASGLPGIVVALALVSLTIDHVPEVYQSLGVLILAYVVMYLSRAVVGVQAALRLVPQSLEDVSRVLGNGSARTFARVTLPLTSPGLVSGGALVFLAIATELTATLMLAPIGTRTLSTQFWSESSALAYGAAAPYAVLLVLMSIPATLLLSRGTVART